MGLVSAPQLLRRLARLRRRLAGGRGIRSRRRTLPAPIVMSYLLMFATGARRTGRRMQDRLVTTTIHSACRSSFRDLRWGDGGRGLRQNSARRDHPRRSSGTSTSSTRCSRKGGRRPHRRLGAGARSRPEQSLRTGCLRADGELLRAWLRGGVSVRASPLRRSAVCPASPRPSPDRSALPLNGTLPEVKRH